EIFGRSMPEIVGGLPTGSCLIDLGAGSCRKAARVIPVLKPVQYLAVDISVEFMGNCLEALRREFPGLAVEGLGIDFSQGLSADAIQAMVPSDRPRVYFYPGSSIGNFHPAEAEAFLRGLIFDGGAQGLVIGVDMVKDVSALELAYDDPLGVTAAFNRNMLLHLNKRLTANFDIRDWDHRAVFNVAESRIEMRLWRNETCRCDGQMLRVLLQKASGSTPRIPTSTRWRHSQRCWGGQGMRWRECFRTHTKDSQCLSLALNCDSHWPVYAMTGRLLAAFATLVGRPFTCFPAFCLPLRFPTEGLRGLFATERRWSRKSLAGPEHVLTPKARAIRTQG
ncbi:MAG: L-histidine N(alpha)-methyltransferase, partial [Burkholderiaceae bacterium]